MLFKNIYIYIILVPRQHRRGEKGKRAGDKEKGSKNYSPDRIHSHWPWRPARTFRTADPHAPPCPSTPGRRSCPAPATHCRASTAARPQNSCGRVWIFHSADRRDCCVPSPLDLCSACCSDSGRACPPHAVAADCDDAQWPLASASVGANVSGRAESRRPNCRRSTRKRMTRRRRSTARAGTLHSPAWWCTPPHWQSR